MKTPMSVIGVLVLMSFSLASAGTVSWVRQGAPSTRLERSVSDSGTGPVCFPGDPCRMDLLSNNEYEYY